MKRILLKNIFIIPLPTLIVAVFMLSTSVIVLTAFEAHVVNVTATIERPPTMCDARSIGYWKSHDGCAGGEGESIWASQIREMTRNFSGAFFGISSEEICQAVWTPGCPSGNNVPAKLCRARAMTLADELNLVSGHLDINALIAGADNGNSAFDRLGLDYNSTIKEALTKIEMIITNSHSTIQQLSDAAYVAERIYSFYEDENSIAPKCVYEPKTTCGGNDITHYGVTSSQTNEPENDFNNSDEDSEQDGRRKNGKKSEDTESSDDGNGLGRHEDNEESEGAETGAGATSTESEINASFVPTDETIDSETDSNSSSTEPAAEPATEPTNTETATSTPTP